MMRDTPPTLSLVVPVYNEESILEAFYRRTSPILDAIDGNHEIVFVDDGSRDRTVEIVSDLARKDGRVRCILLSRNFGKEVAITAGLDNCRGEAAIVIDADLQDPPELIEEFVKKWREGYDVVYGRRTSRDGETFFKKATAKAFYRVIRALSNVDIPPDTGDFRLLSRRALKAVSSLRERHRFMKGVFSWIGFSQVAVFYKRDPRCGGKTKWNYWRLWELAVEGIIGYSYRPLQIASLLGLVVAGFSFGYAVYLVIRTLILGVAVPGYASIMVTLLFLGGVQLISLGIMGEYIGRISNETRHRPIYLVSDMINSPGEGLPGQEKDAPGGKKP